ncbi:T6SS phospholipase effector Tle1-like catalytic domain-containing protein [Pseudomonas juntendi]|uniref:phospholipase effector Tle1 domain-containing protein n=1 Tax=Pseudomonas juntendi TaxID=2666183 RepID=UPI001B8203AA|nr:DUF2235 domain-containing protein [Pseudomonas juntendi]MBR7523347.1 DUF2235 domain-containing protein [Pseudomonas juntendi]
MYNSYRGKKDYDGPLRKYLGSVKIFFVGVWDTVGSLSLGATVNNFHKICPKNVENVRHALALDEVRPHFIPDYWPSGRSNSIVECWFCGSHSNIGGGYQQSELSNIPYIWMAREFLKVSGLELDIYGEHAYSHEAAPEQALGMIRDSFSEFYTQGIMQFVLRTKNIGGNKTPRNFLEGQYFHPSVLDVMKGISEYRPLALRNNEVVDSAFVSMRVIHADDWV